jgi:hypothetical protein
MVAQRDGVSAGCNDFLVVRLRDAEALIRGVLPVDDAKIYAPVCNTAGQIRSDRFASGLAYDIPHKQNAQDDLLRVIPATVPTRLPVSGPHYCKRSWSRVHDVEGGRHHVQSTGRRLGYPLEPLQISN